MANQEERLHFVLFPFMAQGHMIPMVDMARLLAQQGMIITIVTTPLNAARFKTILDRAVKSGLSIRLLELQFPCLDSGLPEGCENFDMLPSLGQALNFFRAANKLQNPVEKLFEELRPRPSCIISDILLTYTLNIANQFQIPRVVFNGVGCFCLVCIYNLYLSKILDRIPSESQYFALPNMPHRVEFTKPQLPAILDDGEMKAFCKHTVETDLASYGVVVNTFEELEPEYVKQYSNARGNKVWCIGPVSLCNKDALDKAERGSSKALVDEHRCLRWLDSQETASVIYACLGSLSNVIPSQLIELGLGLEASNQPFLWVMRGNGASEEVEKWILETGFEERTKGRGLVVRGWAPQVVILSHSAIGGFLTHCGWNSTIEAIAAGVPLITWPLFGDQFCNEKLVIQILQIGVRIGVEQPLSWGKEGKVGVLVNKEDVKRAIETLMEAGEEGEERRKRVKKLEEMAKMALEVGGSSHLNLIQLIQDIKQRNYDRKSGM
ncbi:UDP-glucuronosyl/UDP-glucosyltransferase [Corchorus capsularis]|uniref:Glycosyltransferase n=1 Tax=Corchorus capsularis TaxID=210143 RepID=A0A1R3J457_COCAP|nr:UDP-glucuronosyl/UDP-glucosyltransferase [Corchorus capsularis]